MKILKKRKACMFLLLVTLVKFHTSYGFLLSPTSQKPKVQPNGITPFSVKDSGKLDENNFAEETDRGKEVVPNDLMRIKRGGAQTKLVKGQDKALSDERVKYGENLFNIIKNLPDSSQFKLEYSSGKGSKKVDVSMDAIKFQVPEKYKIKHIFYGLQYYHEFMPDGGQLIKSGVPEPSKFALQIYMKIGGKPFEFAMLPARDRQIFIKFTKKIDDTVSHSYDDIIKNLEDVGHPQKMKNHAKAILAALQSEGREKIDWGDMTPKQIEAAQELIVLTHVAESAVPSKSQLKDFASLPSHKQRPNDVQGGVGGMDLLSEEFFKQISEGKKTFTEVFNTKNGSFVIARIGGKKQIKQTLYKSDKGSSLNNDLNEFQVNSDHSDLSDIDVIG